MSPARDLLFVCEKAEQCSCICHERRLYRNSGSVERFLLFFLRRFCRDGFWRGSCGRGRGRSSRSAHGGTRTAGLSTDGEIFAMSIDDCCRKLGKFDFQRGREFGLGEGEYCFHRRRRCRTEGPLILHHLISFECAILKGQTVITYHIVWQPVYSDLMRNFWHCNCPIHLGPIARCARPRHINLAIEYSDQSRIYIDKINKFISISITWTDFDFLCPNSTSPSTSLTSEMDTDSLSDPPLITMDVNSRSNHSVAHRVTFLFFQCQFAVVRDIDILGETAVPRSCQSSRRIHNAIALTKATSTIWDERRYGIGRLTWVEKKTRQNLVYLLSLLGSRTFYWYSVPLTFIHGKLHRTPRQINIFVLSRYNHSVSYFL